MKALIATLMLAALGGAFLWERNAIVGLRKQNQSLRAEKEEAEKLQAENGRLQPFDASADLRTNGSDKIELLRLRNEVRQLRGSQQEAERLRAANQRMAEELQGGKFKPSRVSDM